ncbi:two-component system, OmpR family, osmolarity sensor histidine kinase EnvZ [Roseovarius marisflavi]|uniref:histidine kinase n=1 Tax=Roseovarius marisflavi TaxID=1054996 RepID=A0A1M7AFE5_9RHOB|nr:ATP-binding protein [Roseovarius marisflavi]SHL41430.1 two-component system, OmpR family, osmolarity sensor histidine kinase EnvZ [Roseovarius marisflavi]
MSLRWLKPYVPRSLYWRATLILLLPVITLLLVVSIVFIQRHFEGVTQQMTETVSREIVAVLGDGTRPPEALIDQPIARTLEIDLSVMSKEDIPETDFRQWFDFSGVVVIREFKKKFPDLQVLELTDDSQVHLYFLRDGQGIKLAFDRRRVSARQPHQLLVNMVFFGVLMTVISYIYLRKQLRPITRLARAAEAFGRGRHVPYRPTGAAEVRAAGGAFLDMRARIERQIEQRTLMLSGVSHDLRTPLTRLRLGLAMLEEDEAEPMLRDVEDMQRLLDGFLAFARGAQEGEAEPVDPIALMRKIVEDAQRSQVNVALTETSGEGEISLRIGSIRRAVENLINNAVRYGSRAEVSVVLTDKSLRIRVEDDGPGIAAESRDEAVKPFTRLEPARNQNRGTGVGLGLSIVLDVARAHGGMLRLGQSDRLGGLQADIVIAR